MPKTERLQPSQSSQLQVECIMIVAPSVLASKERLPSILGAHEASLHRIMIRKLIAQPVTVRITQISSVVALAPIEGDTGRSHQFVTPISGDVIQLRETSLLLIAYIYKIGE